MRQTHRYYLSLGSNIQPETNLAQALEHLGRYGAVEATSRIWESHALGTVGPNFLNACVSFLATIGRAGLKRDVTTDIETKMGRVRTKNRLAPRAIDIDILMADNRPLNLQLWSHPFVVVPMAELLPDFPHPTDHRPLAKLAQEIQARTWIVARPERLSQSPSPQSKHA